jgi:hypothetical protein
MKQIKIHQFMKDLFDDLLSENSFLVRRYREAYDCYQMKNDFQYAMFRNKLK